MAQVQRTAHNPPSAPQPIGAYSLAMEVSAGRLLFVAGQVGLDASGNLVGSGDAAAQTRQVFENIGQILSGVGASFDNVVELTTYVVGRESIQGFIQARTQIYPDIFSSGDIPLTPCWSSTAWSARNSWWKSKHLRHCRDLGLTANLPGSHKFPGLNSIVPLGSASQR